MGGEKEEKGRRGEGKKKEAKEGEVVGGGRREAFLLGGRGERGGKGERGEERRRAGRAGRAGRGGIYGRKKIHLSISMFFFSRVGGKRNYGQSPKQEEDGPATSESNLGGNSSYNIYHKNFRGSKT
jgi:hypothetical protein